MPDSWSDPRHACILFIAEIEQFGGAERSLLALSSLLYRRGLKHYFLTYADHCGLTKFADHPIDIVELRPGSSVRHKITALNKHLEARNLSQSRLIVSGYQPALHSTLAGARGFHTLMHDTPSLFGDREHRSYAGKLRIAVSNKIVSFGLRSGGQTIVTSEYLRAECRRDFGIDPAIVQMGGMTGRDKKRIRPVEQTLHLLSVSRVEANKRIDWLLRSLAELEKKPLPLSSRINWRFDVVGRGSLIPALKQMASALGIDSRVIFHDFVPDRDLEDIYDQAHLFLMPAVQGYGIPAIEAIHRGIPVLVHRESGVSDLLLDTPWATVAEGGEAEMITALTFAIEKAIVGSHHTATQPGLPSEEDWAKQVAGLCGWM